MPKQVEIILGGRHYTIREKPTGINVQWRKQLKETSVMAVFESLDNVLAQLVQVINLANDEGKSWRDVDLAQIVRLAGIVPVVMRGLVNSIDDIIDLLYRYEPNLVTERAWLDDNAYDSEYVAAFCEMLKLVFPIMGVWGMVGGSRAQQTPSSLPVANGASGLPASGPKQRKSLTSS